MTDLIAEISASSTERPRASNWVTVAAAAINQAKRQNAGLVDKSAPAAEAANLLGLVAAFKTTEMRDTA
jgi:methyl-accepting chemotaxis protein